MAVGGEDDSAGDFLIGDVLINLGAFFRVSVPGVLGAGFDFRSHGDVVTDHCKGGRFFRESFLEPFHLDRSEHGRTFILG